jgi:hypothetical protein
MHGRMAVKINVFLTSALVGSGWSVSCPGCFILKESVLGTRWIEGCVGPRVVHNDMEKCYGYLKIHIQNYLSKFMVEFHIT